MKQKYRLKTREEIKKKYSREASEYAIHLSAYPEDGGIVEFDIKYIEDTIMCGNGEFFKKVYWKDIDCDFPNNTFNEYTLFHFFDEVKVEKEIKTNKIKDVVMNYVLLKEMEDLEILLEKGYYFKVLGKETNIEKVKQLLRDRGINVVALRDDKSLGYHSDGGQKYSEEGMKLIDVGDINKTKLDIIKEVNKKDLTFLSVGFVIGGLVGGLIINKVRG